MCVVDTCKYFNPLALSTSAGTAAATKVTAVVAAGIGVGVAVNIASSISAIAGTAGSTVGGAPGRTGAGGFASVIMVVEQVQFVSVAGRIQVYYM